MNPAKKCQVNILKEKDKSAKNFFREIEERKHFKHSKCFKRKFAMLRLKKKKIHTGNICENGHPDVGRIDTYVCR